MSFNLDNRPATSTFNEGVFQIQRLHNYWTQANQYSRYGELDRWRWILDTIWRELSRDAIRIETKKYKPDDFNKLTKENAWFKRWEILSQKYAVAKEMSRPDAQYVCLSDMEIFLRSLQDKAGKGGKYKDSSMDGMD